MSPETFRRRILAGLEAGRADSPAPSRLHARPPRRKDRVAQLEAAVQTLCSRIDALGLQLTAAILRLSEAQSGAAERQPQAAPSPRGRLVVAGSGGHAKVVVDVVRSLREFEIVGCTGVTAGVDEVLGVPVLGDDSVLSASLADGVAFAFPAVGDNRTRRKLLRLLTEQGFTTPVIRAPGSWTSPSASLARGTIVMPNAVVNAGAVVAEGAIINTGATVDHDCQIGPCAHIAPGAHLAGGCHVEEGALVGVGASVLPGRRIGAWAVVGGGAVVARDVEPGAVVKGVPARGPGGDPA